MSPKKTAIVKRLNTEVPYCKQNPNYSDIGMIGIMINCKGEVVQCKMDIKIKKPELNKQIEAVFNSLGDWKASKLNGEEMDAVTLFGFKIVNGVFVME